MREDDVFDGDLVAVQRTTEAHKGQVVVARVDGDIAIKHFDQTKIQIRLLPRNLDYTPIMVAPGDDFAIKACIAA